MPPGSQDEPLAPLSYSTAPTPDERPYGRGDRTLFIVCALLAGTNLSLAGFFRWVDDRELSEKLGSRERNYLRCLPLHLGGRPALVLAARRDDLPPFSAFALACVACLTLASLAGNLLFARLVLR